MSGKDKLMDNLDKRVEERRKKISQGEARAYALREIGLPDKEKYRDELYIKNQLKILESLLPDLKGFLKYLKKNINHISDKDRLVAVYLLLGKSIGNLETLLLLASKGKCTELVEICRSAVESNDLAEFLLWTEDSSLVARWFSGDIIPNRESREGIDKSLNNELSESIPLKEAKANVYSIYSLYTHSSYAALLDTVDVFHEDLDWDNIAGYHYTKKYLHLIFSLAYNLLLLLKSTYIYIKDKKMVKEIDVKLNLLSGMSMSPKDAKEILKDWST